MENVNTDQVALSSIIGFYNMVFCSNLHGYAKCWLDGYKEYTLFRYDEILNFAMKDHDAEASRKVRIALSEALRESSIFIWVVDAHIVKRLSASQSQPESGAFVKSLANGDGKPKESGSTMGWHNDLGMDKNGNVTLKF